LEAPHLPGTPDIVRSIKSFAAQAKTELSEKFPRTQNQIQALLAGDHGRERKGPRRRTACAAAAEAAELRRLLHEDAAPAASSASSLVASASSVSTAWIAW
jgi:hypothetical protein